MSFEKLGMNTEETENKGKWVPYRSEDNKNLICFIHGFSGDPRQTFEPMPQLIMQEDALSGWDVLSHGYSTALLPDIGKGIWSADPDISEIAGYLNTNLRLLFQHYNRVALIGHSMGGLVIQRALLNLEDISKISHVLFYGTPSGGLKKAGVFRWFKNQIRNMDDDGEFITTLRREWNQKFPNAYPFKFATIAGETDEFVPPESSLNPFPEPYRMVTGGNHVTMTKPANDQDTSFRILKHLLADDPNHLIGRTSDLANLISEYHGDVYRLGKRLSELDKNGLRQYIFALEGTGKLEEAIQALENTAALQSNTDLLGMLGGRYKRKYLMERTQPALDKAIECYDTALRLSLEKDNSAQIYYHAINLAFLYLMQDDTDRTQNKGMAQLALKHCDKVNEGPYWEDATRAEAHLYLGDLEKSVAHYQSAIEKCGNNIRETSSMYINARHACITLDQPGWESRISALFD
ncbi:MAG: alpha/beta fold hydrolase [Saprospiraceae bacterium]